MTYLLIALVSYLVGAIPTGYIVGKALRRVDVRQLGSGNTGATNVLRTMGPRVSAVVLIGDLAKGVLPVVVAGWLVESSAAQVVAALAALAGHNWPVYLGFRGGRGVATGLGGLLAMSPLVAIGCLTVALLVIAFSRLVSLGSLLGAVLVVAVLGGLYFAGLQPLDYWVYAIVGAPLVMYRHRDNIARLLAGTEHRLGEKVA